MDRDEALFTAARDTLVHIAGVSGRAGKDLRPGQSLTVDLGLADPDLAVLSTYQQRVARRLRPDGQAVPLTVDVLYDCVVWEVLALTVQGATGQRLDAARAGALLVEAAAGLRGGTARPSPGDPPGRG